MVKKSNILLKKESKVKQIFDQTIWKHNLKQKIELRHFSSSVHSHSADTNN